MRYWGQYKEKLTKFDQAIVSGNVARKHYVFCVDFSGTHVITGKEQNLFSNSKTTILTSGP